MFIEHMLTQDEETFHFETQFCIIWYLYSSTVQIYKIKNSNMQMRTIYRITE